MDCWADIVDAPDHDTLTKLDKKFRDDNGRDTDDFIKKWYCPSCGDVFMPVRNLLFDLPAYGCNRCQEKNPASYKWDLSKTKINNVRLDCMVYNQYNTPYCTLFSVVAAFDFSRRVDGALHGISESGPLDVIEMRDTYERVTGMRVGFPDKSRLYDGFDALPLMLRVFRDHGIAYFCDTILDYGSQQSIPRLYIQSFFKVDHTDILLVTRLIASGFPLVTSFRVGRLYHYLCENQVYHCPDSVGNSLGCHAVAIIGSGAAPYQKGDVETFYVVRNSKGERGHPCHTKEGFGGDFIVWARDVKFIWGFYLPGSLLHDYIYCIRKGGKTV